MISLCQGRCLNWEKEINSRSSEDLKDVEKRAKDVDFSTARRNEFAKTFEPMIREQRIISR